MKTRFEHMKHAAERKIWKVQFVLMGRSGENFIDNVIKALMTVMIGALLLAGSYALFSENVLPALSRCVIKMFNYAG